MDTPWMDLDQAAAYTQYSVSYLRRLAMEGLVPCTRSGKGRGTFRFHRDRIDRWLLANHNPARKES
jgi:excisionase family DNA binding protein